LLKIFSDEAIDFVAIARWLLKSVTP